MGACSGGMGWAPTLEGLLSTVIVPALVLAIHYLLDHRQPPVG